MRSASFTARLLVLLQLGCIGLLALTGPLTDRSSPSCLLLQFVGLFLGAWALSAIGRGSFSVLPAVRAGATLSQRGPFRFVRHPMYTAVALITLSWVLLRTEPFRVATWLTLVVVLLVKSRYEERLLARAYPGYQAYRKRTKAFIPFLV